MISTRSGRTLDASPSPAPRAADPASLRAFDLARVCLGLVDAEAVVERGSMGAAEATRTSSRRARAEALAEELVGLARCVEKETLA